MDKEMKQLINETLPSFVGIDKIGIFINLSVTFVQVLCFWCSIVLVVGTNTNFAWNILQKC